MRLLGILTFNFLFGLLFAFVGLKYNSVFFKNFLDNQILSISGTIFGFVFSGISFLVGYLIQIDRDFSRTKKEIKHNIYFMGFCFVFMMFLIFRNSDFENKCYNLFYKSFIMMTFFLQFYGVYEIINSIIMLKKIDK